MKTSKCPCNDCLVLGACRHREVVTCDPLVTYFTESLQTILTYHDTFMKIVEYLPKVRKIYGYNRVFTESLKIQIDRNREERK